MRSPAGISRIHQRQVTEVAEGGWAQAQAQAEGEGEVGAVGVSEQAYPGSDGTFDMR